MLEKYANSQKMFYNYFKNSFDKMHILHAYLIETNNVSYSYDLAIDLAKFLLCNGIFDEKICNLIDSCNYPGLKIIGSDDKVKKGDIVDLKTDFSMKSIDNNKQIYILKNAQELNKNAANSILKFLEEPESDIIAILLCDKVINVLPTIVSRCQIINLINDDNVYENIFSSIYNNEIDIDFNDFVKEKIDEFFLKYLNFEENGCKILADLDFYNVKNEIKEFLSFGYYLYNDVLSYKLGRKIRSLAPSSIEKIADKNDIYDIMKKIDIIDRFISDFKFNVNINLFLDNFIISMGSVYNG